MPRKSRPAPHRPVRRDDVHAEHVLDFAHDVERVATVPVHLVHEGEDRNPPQLADLAELARLRLDATRRVDQHHRAVRRHQRAVGVLAEVAMARRIEDVDAMLIELEVEHRARHRDATLFLEFQPVAGRMPRGLLRPHRSGFPHGASVEKQLLRQRRLARIGMGDDREGPAALDLAPDLFRTAVGRHGDRLLGGLGAPRVRLGHASRRLGFGLGRSESPPALVSASRPEPPRMTAAGVVPGMRARCKSPAGAA